MMYLIQEIQFFLYLGLIAGAFIGWRFFDDAYAVKLTTENEELHRASTELRSRLRACEESVQRGGS